jgi:hypothetical protein
MKPTIRKHGTKGYNLAYTVRYFVRHENGQDWYSEKVFSKLSDARFFVRGLKHLELHGFETTREAA